MNGGAANERELIVWHISDGRRGHDNQCLGLVQALYQLRPCRYFKITRIPLTGLMLPFLTRRFPAGDGLPDPDIIIGAGHHTHLSLLSARRARRGRSVVLMRPSIPASWFDLCLIPTHDRQPSTANVIRTTGALTRIRPTNQHDPRRGLILIGGPSRHHSWDNEALLRQIELIVSQADVRWLVSDSPRTPGITRQALAALSPSNVKYTPYLDQGESWLPGQLGRAGSTWVTEDSVSMIYDALTSGAAVGLLQVPHKHENRITRIADGLGEKKMVTLFRDWQISRRLAPAPHVLDEAARCAGLLLQELSL